jgi:hypothetical protein
MTMTGEEIRMRGLAALRRELGRAGLARFLQQFKAGTGNYTEERGELLKDMTLEGLQKRVRAKRAKSGHRR